MNLSIEQIHLALCHQNTIHDNNLIEVDTKIIAYQKNLIRENKLAQNYKSGTFERVIFHDEYSPIYLDSQMFPNFGKVDIVWRTKPKIKKYHMWCNFHWNYTVYDLISYDFELLQNKTKRNHHYDTQYNLIYHNRVKALQVVAIRAKLDVPIIIIDFIFVYSYSLRTISVIGFIACCINSKV